jgi:hypothetical protein
MKSFQLIGMLCLVFMGACNSAVEDDKEEINPFPQTNYSFLDLYVRYLEDTRELKTIAKTFSKNISGELIPDTTTYAIFSDKMPLKKMAAGEHVNYYQLEEKYPHTPELTFTFRRTNKKSNPQYEIKIPMDYFGNLQWSQEGEDIVLAWDGSPANPQDQVLVILQDSQGKVFSLNKKTETSSIVLEKKDWKDVQEGKISLYLVRKSNARKTQDEFGHLMSREIYSQTLSFQKPR